MKAVTHELLTKFNLSDKTDRLVLSDLLEESGREEEVRMLRDTYLHHSLIGVVGGRIVYWMRQTSYTEQLRQDCALPSIDERQALSAASDERAGIDTLHAALRAVDSIWRRSRRVEVLK